MWSRTTEKDIYSILYRAFAFNKRKETRKLQKVLWLDIDYFHSQTVVRSACFFPEIQ
jgi:hypothetical protein